MKLIDDSFYVTQENWGNWISLDKEGKRIVTSHTEQNCIDATHYFLQMIQENTNGTL